MPAAKRKPKGEPPPAIAKRRLPRPEVSTRPSPEQFARMAARAGKGGRIIGARPKQGQR